MRMQQLVARGVWHEQRTGCAGPSDRWPTFLCGCGLEYPAGKSTEDSRGVLTPERIPADWRPCEQQLEQARERYTLIDVDAETQKFVEVMSKSKKRRKSWLSTWRGTLIAENAEQQRQARYARDRAVLERTFEIDAEMERDALAQAELAAAEAAANGGRPRLRIVSDT